MLTYDISVFIVFHHERAYAIPALRSMENLVRDARSAGLSVESIALLDRPDEETKRLVSANGHYLNSVNLVDFGDLGLTRNAGVKIGRGRYLAFLDGDDLWGSNWLLDAYITADKIEHSGSSAIWHPEVLYYFNEKDFDHHSTNEQPSPEANSFYFFHEDSTNPNFDRRNLLFNNIWSSNMLAHRTLYETYPYHSIDKSRGLGIEDWSWNIETTWRGIAHRIVPNTVHLIRIKTYGSLGQQNSTDGLLPYLPKLEWPFV